MKLFKRDLLTLLISLFILGSCQNPDGIGLEVDPENAIEGKLVDTLSIISSTVKEDSVFTQSLTKYPVGYINDPAFGPSAASSSLSLTLPSENLKFGSNAILDSAVLVLKYADEYAGDINSNLAFQVNQLATTLNSTSSYFNTAQHPASQNVVGSKTAKVNLKDSVTVIDIVKGKPDVSKKNAPQLRIPITEAFISGNFLNGDSLAFKNNTVFNEYIKGLQISVNRTGTSGLGGIALFDVANSDSRLEIYYKNQNTVIDTNVVSFSFNTQFSAATVTHNYSGTSVETQLANPNTRYSVNYIQPLGGVKTRLEFPYVRNLQSLGNIIINKAELIVQVEPGTDIFSPSPRLYLYRTDIAGQRQPIPDVSLGLSDLSLGGFYDSTKKQYKFALTAYLQDILSGRLIQYDTFITAIDPRSSAGASLFPSATTASRVIIGSGSETSTAKMTLNIIYTKVN